MNSQLEKRLEKTYDLIKRSFTDVTVDSLHVVKQVEKYHQFWKPEKINVILLAESHVYTDDFDFRSKIDESVLSEIVAGYPSRLVRFVYCLGYGETQLLERATSKRRNAGTPQFWKIFCSCVAESQEDLGFWRILRKGTPVFGDRLRNKVRVLEAMRNKGIWLVDASVVGLYGTNVKRTSPVFKEIIRMCWDNYVAHIVDDSRPKYVIVIGKGVAKALAFQLKMPYETIDLPQAHLTRQQQLDNYKRYNTVCSAIVEGRPVPDRLEPPTITSEADPEKTKDSERIAKMTGKSHTEEKLLLMGYRKMGSKDWTNGTRMLHVVTSSVFGKRTRITWKEKWKDDYAVIYDYSRGNGPVCVLSIDILFNSNFISKKRKTRAYAKSGFWWTQTFPPKHELVKLVTSYENRLDIM